MYEDLQRKMDEQQGRWLTFLEKLENRAKELYDTALPELNALKRADDDPNKAAYHKVLSGVCGQISTIASKARDTHEKEVLDFYYYMREDIKALHPLAKNLTDFRDICREKFNEFETLMNNLEKKLREETRDEVEEEYAKIIESFNVAKSKFLCSQCGYLLPIERIFFISVHIPCPACGAQNTLEPGRDARNLQFIAEKLAQKRCEPLLDAYNNEKQNERDLYHKAHAIKLDAIHKSDKEKAIAKEQIEAINLERSLFIKNAPHLYNKYLRAVCDEMNGILPEFRAHHEKFYLERKNQFNTGE
jgi:hypothetical protein